MYYYSYCLLARFARAYANKDGDYAFTAILLYCIPVIFNVITILPLILGRAFFVEHLWLMILITCAIPSLLHYLFLFRGRKYLAVINLYDLIHANKSVHTKKAFVFYTYLLVTFIVSFYLIQLIRSENVF